MALIQCDFFSETLKMGASMNIILPQPMAVPGTSNRSAAIGIDTGPARSPGGGIPTLYLLHGLSDDHTAWTRRTAIERYVSGLNLAVVMPGVARSYYADMVHGGAYWSFVSEELPHLCQQMFGLSSRREDNFAAGLSMGGYGAFKLALNHPDRYAAAASLSGALDPATLGGMDPSRAAEWASIFGDPQRIEGTASDLMGLSAALMKGDHQDLPLYACCGTADFIYDHSTTFRDHAERLGMNLTYEEHAGREHEWGYWDQQIQRVLAWLPMSQSVGEIAMR